MYTYLFHYLFNNSKRKRLHVLKTKKRNQCQNFVESVLLEEILKNVGHVNRLQRFIV